MASLADTIKLNSGNLAQSSSEELAALSGRSAAPSSPMETGVIGGNPDQAKMAKTPNQQTSAIRQAIQGTNDLNTAQRQKQVSGQASEGQQSQLDKANQLKGLNSLESRVSNLTNQLIAENSQTGQVAGLTADSTDAETKALLDRIKTNPADTAAILALNKKLGKSDANSMLTADQILSQFGDTESLIAKQVGDNVGQALTAGKLPIQDMGFNSPAELAGALGIDEQALTGMSIPDLIKQINQVVQTEFQTTSALQSKANDLRLGAAERAEARKQLRDMGAIGVTSAESDIDKLADQIADADQVEFMGKKVAVGDLLGNEYMSGVVANYLDGLDDTTGIPNSEFSKELEKTQPELVSFIKKNKTALDAAKSQISSSVKALADQQVKNQAIGTSSTGEKLSDDIMKKMFPDWGSMRDAPYDTSKYPLLSILKDPNTTGAQANSLVKFANETSTKWPEMVNELSSMSRSQLAALGALGDTNAYNKFASAMDEASKIRSMKNPDDMAVLLGVNSLDDLKQLRTNLMQGVNFGTVNKETLSSIPGLAEGDFTKMFNWIKTQSPTSLQGILDKNGKSIMDMTAAVRNKGAESINVPGNLGQLFTNKSVLDDTDIEQYKGNATPAELYKFMKENPTKVSGKASNKINDLMTKEANTQAAKIIKDNGIRNYATIFTELDPIGNNKAAVEKEYKRLVDSNQIHLANEYAKKQQDAVAAAKKMYQEPEKSTLTKQAQATIASLMDYINKNNLPQSVVQNQINDMNKVIIQLQSEPMTANLSTTKAQYAPVAAVTPQAADKEAQKQKLATLINGPKATTQLK